MLRESTQINRRPASNIHHATRYAERIGIPLNRHSTISFAQLGIPPDTASQTLQKVIAERYAPWLRRHNKNKQCVAPTYVWTIEAAGGCVAAHWAVHIPSGMMREFEAKLKKWLLEMSADNSLGSALKTTRIPNITGLKRYILKGTDPHYAKICKIVPIPQGVVYGKRSGHSRNLGPVARRAAGYSPRKNVNFSQYGK